MRRLLLFCLLIFIASKSQAIKHIVTSMEDDANNPSEGMLRYAIENAANGDTIIFNVSTVTLDTTLRISGGILTIDGGEGVIIHGNNQNRIFNISCYSSSDNINIKNLTIQNGRIEDVTAMGGGMYAYISSGNLLVENCIFKNNTVVSSTDGQGGALRTYGGTFQNCFFLNNEVSGTASALGGGGIYSIGGTFINCVIAGNIAKYGGGIYTSSSSEYINCTITQNNASNSDAGGGINCEDNCAFINCISYNNKSNSVENNIFNYLNSSTFSYCAVEIGNSIVGSNNNIGLTTTPFTHSGVDSLSIYQGSDCENAGTTSGITVLSKDIIGNDRIYDDKIDIGAYEYNVPIYDAITVTNNSFDPLVEYSLPWAIEHADSACIITFDNNYHIDFTYEILIDESITIDGSGHTIELDGKNNNRIFKISGTDGDTINLKSLLIQNGYNFSSGGGIYVYTSNDIHLNFINCAFENNQSEGNYGGAIYLYNSCSFINCTFYNNKSNFGGGAVKCSDAEFTNCLFYENNAQDYIDVEGEDVTYSNCASVYILPGIDNVQLFSNPLIGGTGADRLHLNENSFCSNAGTEDISALDLPLVDLDGNQRIQNDTIDIGAYESSYFSTPARTLYKNIIVTNNSFDVTIENSLPWALAHADDSCTIIFSGDFTINVSQDLSIGTKNLKISGSPYNIVLVGGDSTRIFNFVGNSTTKVQLESLTIQNGYSIEGGGIRINHSSGGNLFISNCLFKNNNAYHYGGAIYIDPILTLNEGTYINNSAFVNNFAKYRGGAIYTYIKIYEQYRGNSFINCTFTGNKSEEEGAGVYCDGKNSFTNCIFFKNKSGSGSSVNIYGGEINYCASDENLYSSNSIKLYSSPFVENGLQLNSTSHCSNAGTPDTTGLNLPLHDLEGNSRIVNDTIDIGAYESSYYTTAPYTKFDTIIVTNNSSNALVENSFYWALAHINNNGLITFDNDYKINITKEIILGNKSIIIDGGSNRIVLDGGDSTRIFRFDGHYKATNIKLKNLTIQHGYAIDGGGLYSDPFHFVTIEIINCLFYKNNAEYGGGAFVSDRRTPFYNCVFLENNASDAGGGLYSYGNVKLINCSLTNNYANNSGGGVIAYQSTLINSLIYGNKTKYNSYKNIKDRNGSTIDHCASDDDFSSYCENNLLLTEDPFIGSDNIYDSLMIKQGSVLINAGNPVTTGLNLPETDFKLNSRIASDTIDIGAYEYFDHIITSSTIGGGKVTPKIAHIIKGRDQQFSILPDNGFKADSLWIDNVYVDSIESYTFYNVVADHEIKATFKLDTFNIITIIGENGSATPGDTNITYFESVEYTITPDENYRIDSAYFGNRNITNDLIQIDNQYFYTIDSLLSDDTLRIVFYKPTTYYIKTIVGENGTVTPGDTGITFFDSIQYVITPDVGYIIDTAMFGNKSIISNLINLDNYYTYTIDSLSQNDTLYVTFKPKAYKIITIIHGEGVINPSNFTTTCIDTTEIIIKPHLGYHIMSATFGGNSILDELVEYDYSSIYTLKDVLQDDTLEVTFVIDTCRVITNVLGNGLVTPMDTTVVAGQAVFFYIEPLLSYGVDSIFYNGEEIDIDTYLYYHDPYFAEISFYIPSDVTLLVKFKGYTSINDDFKNNQISVYPNPTNGIINLNIPSEIIDYKLLIISQNGEILFNNPHYNKRDVNLSNYPIGTYIISVEFNGTRLSYPIIKQ